MTNEILKDSQAIDWILSLIGKQGISIKRHRKQLQTARLCEMQEISYVLIGKLSISIFYFMNAFVQLYETTSSI